MRSLGFLAVLAALACGYGSPGFAAPDVITPPDWLRKPTPEQLLAVWPTRDLGQVRTGKGVISCSVSIQGALFDCRVVSEEPVGSGFGAAALAVAPQLLLKPGLRNGKPEVTSDVHIPVNFGGRPTSYLGNDAKTLTRPVLTNVVWTEAPTYAQVVAAFPVKARIAKTGGNVVLDCSFKSDGRLTGCEVLGETPKGLDLGRAAKTLMPLFMGPTLRSDGASTLRAGVQIPITFPIEMTSATQPVTGKPRWTAAPSAEALLAAIPATAATAGVRTARVVMSCTIAQGGGLEGCKVSSEDPVGLGFGAATLGLAKDIRVSIWTAEGLPTIGGSINVPIRYDIPQASPPKP